MERTTDGGETVQATERAFAIIETVARRNGARLTEISDTLDAPKSTVYKHLQTLTSLDYVYQDGYEYHVSPRFIEIGNEVKSQYDVPEFRSAVDHLAEITQEIAGVYVESGGLGVDIYQTVGDRAAADVGTVTNSSYLHCSAPGKAILAEMEREEVLEIIDRFGMPALTEHTIDTEQDLFDDLTLVQERGVAFERDEQRVGLRGLAMAIPDTGTTSSAAIYVAGSSERLVGKRFEQDYPGILADSITQIERTADDG